MADDHRIDEALRDVPLPPGLRESVDVGLLFSDAAIDRELARVAVPEGLAARIRTATFTPGPGRPVDLDRAAVVLPAATAEAARRPGASDRRMDGRLPAIIAALAGLAALIVVGTELARRIDPVASGAAHVLARNGERAMLPGDVPITLGAAEPAPSLDLLEPLPPAPAADDDDLEIAVDWPRETVAPASNPPAVRGAAVGVAAGPPSAGAGAGMRIVPVPHGQPRRTVPRVAGFDLGFEMAHGEQPFVDPRRASLAVDHPPLAMATASFDAVVRAAVTTRKGIPAELRTEELLAALPPPRLPPSSGPQVAVYGVRSLRPKPPSWLVEVCVVAPPPPLTGTPPLDVVLALDGCAGIQPLVWQRICRAVAAVATQMREGDRVSVVVGGLRPRVAGRRLDAAGLRRLAGELSTEPAASETDFDATMRFATEEAGGPARPLVVVAALESVEQSRGAGRAAVAGWRESSARLDPEAERSAALRFVLVDPMGTATPEPGFGRVPCDARGITQAVVERVFAVPTLTARQCRLAVAFDPQVVAAYRLVGHRQSALESLAAGQPAAVDLHAGETFRVVYEVVPLASQGTAVTATLSYRPVGADGELRVAARLPVQAVEAVPLPAPHGCELLLAAGVGELATESAHLGPRWPAAQAVADLAAAWQRRGDVTPQGILLLDAFARLGLSKNVKPAPNPRR